MNKKRINVPKQIKFLMLLIPSLIIGFIAQSYPSYAKEAYTPIKTKTYKNVPYHWNGQSSHAYLWNANLTKRQHRLAHWPVTTWYVSKSLKMTNGHKTGIFYKATNSRKTMSGYIWKGYLTKGALTKGTYPAGLIDSKLNQSLISLFPGTIPDKQLQQVAEYYIHAVNTYEPGDTYYEYEGKILGAEKQKKASGFSTYSAVPGAYNQLRQNKVSFLQFEKNWLQKYLKADHKTFSDFSGWSIGAYAFPKNSIFYGIIMIALLPPTTK
ncbi:hypothetical protein [Lentilactobacillus parafarraginis]|uniref:D-alanyl-D-alanine carboxypeptidase n=1 Tax=Lentilactobacillus parafarraginis DSM 18390 = JCM 14109 TaxID=1423786 RepID=A0A0R1YPX0_9LACO|nr:hypothetical protein [Lentilactobacillus parafarraginis]KRM44391.1 hypothetical protein FD47_GL000516 [Lentilactobacillus parafarraginis DSM 18390 = JCM 14109]